LHQVDLVAAAAVGAEGDSGGRPGGFVFLSVGGESEIAWVAAVGVDDEDVGVAVGIAGVGDLRAVGRPGGLTFPALSGGESSPVRATGADDVEIDTAGCAVAGAVIDDLASVGRPARMHRHRVIRRD